MKVNCSASATLMFCGNLNEMNCVCYACIAFHGIGQCSLSCLSGLRAQPIFGILTENDIKTTSCVAVLRRWSTWFTTVGAHVDFGSWVSHVSHGDDASRASALLQAVVTIDVFKRAARCTLRFTTPFFLSSFLSSWAWRSSAFLKAHHDY